MGYKAPKAAKAYGAPKAKAPKASKGTYGAAKGHKFFKGLKAHKASKSAAPSYPEPQGVYDAGVSSGYAVKNDEWTPVNGAAGSVESANYNPEESSYNNYDLKGLQSEDRADVDESGEVEEEEEGEEEEEELERTVGSVLTINK